MTEKRIEEWLAARQETSQLIDRLGKKVDREIIDIVTILRLMGFATISSCSGHLERDTGGPYVLMTSPEAGKYADMARKHEVGTEEYNYQRKEALKYLAKDASRLFLYIEEFYEVKNPTYPAVLTVEQLPMAMFQLRCIGQDFLQVAAQKDRGGLLASYREEINMFSDFLKRKYFR